MVLVEQCGQVAARQWIEDIERRLIEIVENLKITIEETIGKRQITRVAFGSREILENDINKMEYIGRPIYAADQQGCVDSGATAMLITPETGDMLQNLGFGDIISYPLNEGPKVEFAGGDDSIAQIVGYIPGDGELVGKLEIVDNLHANLIGIRYFVDRGYEVVFGVSGVFVIRRDGDGNIVSKRYIGFYDSERGLFIADIKAMLSKNRTGDGILIQRDEKLDAPRKALRTVGVKKIRVTQKVRRKIRLFHLVMKHLPLRTIALGIENGWWHGLDPEITAAACRALAEEEWCYLCAMIRAKRSVSKGSGVKQNLKPGQRFATDVIGKFHIRSLGCDTAVTIRDLATGFTAAYGLMSKKSMKEALRRWTILMASFGHKVLGGRTDAGSVENSQDFLEAMSELNLDVKGTPPYEPQKDIERGWGTLKDDLAGIIASSEMLTEKDWLPSLVTVVDMRNLVGNSSSEAIDPTKTPYEIITGMKPDISIMQEVNIGDIVVVKCPDKERKIGMTRNHIGRVMGVETNGTKGVSVNLAGSGDKIVRRGGVISLESPNRILLSASSKRVVSIEPDKDAEGMMKITISGDNGQQYSNTLEGYLQRENDRQRKELDEEEKRLMTVQPRHGGAAENSRSSSSLASSGVMEGVTGAANSDSSRGVIQFVSDEMGDANKYIDKDGGAGEGGIYFQLENGDDQTDDDVATSPTIFAGASRVFSSSMDGGRIKVVSFNEDLDGTLGDSFEDFNVISDEILQNREEMIMAYKARVKRDDDNPTVRTVEKRPDLWDRWAPAMMKEFWGMIEKDSIEEVDEETAKELGVSRHVTTLVMKNHDAGSEKARITIDGGQELRNGIFEDRALLYSPALDEIGLKFLVSMAAYYNMSITYSDVEQAFMYNDLEDAIVKRNIVIQLSQFECGKKGGGYYKYKKLGYGAPDAGVVFYNSMANFLEKVMGFSKCEQFTCVWVRLFGERGLVLVGLATDDLVKTGTRDDETQHFLERLKVEMDKRWKMKHGECTMILGVDVTKNMDGSITLTQNKQIQTIKQHFFPGETPVPEIWALGLKDGAVESVEELVQVPTTEYRTGLGKLSHMRITRSDARPGLAIAAESSTDPRVRNMRKLSETAAYIITTRKMGLTYHRGPMGANPRKMLGSWAASDASWSMTSTGQSRLGYMIWMGDSEYFKSEGVCTAAVRAKSMRELAVSRSATSCELAAQVEVTDEIISLRLALAQVAGMEDVVFADENETCRELMAKPSNLRHKISTADVQKMLPSNDPTLMRVDNRTLANAIQYDHTSQIKKLKTQIRHINYMKHAIRTGQIKQVLVKTKDQPADMLTKILTSPSLHWMHMEELMGSHPVVLEYKARVADMRRKRMSQGTPVQVKSSSNGAGGGESGYDEQQRMDDEQRMQVEAESCSVVDAPSESTAAFGAVAMAAAIAMDDVEMQQDDDAESSSTATAAGATIVAAAAKRAATADEDPLALQASMKQMLMAEIVESKRLSKAAENSLLNGAESERTARVRAQLKVAKQQPSEEMEMNPIEEDEEITVEMDQPMSEEIVMMSQDKKKRKRPRGGKRMQRTKFNDEMS